MEHFLAMAKEDPPFSSEEKRAEHEASRKAIRKLASILAGVRAEPTTRDSAAAIVEQFFEDSPDYNEGGRAVKEDIARLHLG
jgi:hypothetical protein